MADEAVPRALKEYTAFLWPILIATVGGFWTWSQDIQADRKLEQERLLKLQAQCFDQTHPAVEARLALRKAEDANLADRDALREEFILAGIRAATACRAAGMETPIPLEKRIEAEARALDDTDLRLAAFESVSSPQRVAGAFAWAPHVTKEPTPDKPQSPPPELRPGGEPTHLPKGRPTDAVAAPIRLYVQYSREADKAEAEALMDASRSTSFNGRTVSVPGVERVTRAPSRMELRCLTAVDCKQAEGLAAWVADRLNRPAGDVRVVSLAATYEGRGAKTGNYEFWFPAP